jgi:hypothetical protein
MIPLRMLELQYAAVLRDEVYSGYVHPKSEILTACKARAGDEIKATQQIWYFSEIEVTERGSRGGA